MPKPLPKVKKAPAPKLTLGQRTAYVMPVLMASTSIRRTLASIVENTVAKWPEGWPNSAWVYDDSADVFTAEMSSLGALKLDPWNRPIPSVALRSITDSSGSIESWKAMVVRRDGVSAEQVSLVIFND